MKVRAVSSPSDAELIARARAGDEHAFRDLRARHAHAAHRLVRRLGWSGSDGVEIVDLAFSKMRTAFEHGEGPDIAFRTYLFESLTQVAAEQSGRSSVDHGNGSRLAAVYESLPEHWQAVLWYADIEGLSPADVETHLGLTPTQLAALAYRARGRVRREYVAVHRAAASSAACRLALVRIEAYALAALSTGEVARVERHLASCTECRELAAELADLRGSLTRAVAPRYLGPASAAYLAKPAGVAPDPRHGSKPSAHRRGRSRGRAAATVAAVSVLLAGLVTWMVYGAAASSVTDAEVALEVRTGNELGGNSPDHGPRLTASDETPAEAADGTTSTAASGASSSGPGDASSSHTGTDADTGIVPVAGVAAGGRHPCRIRALVEPRGNQSGAGARPTGTHSDRARPPAAGAALSAHHHSSAGHLGRAGVADADGRPVARDHRQRRRLPDASPSGSATGAHTPPPLPGWRSPSAGCPATCRRAAGPA